MSAAKITNKTNGSILVCFSLFFVFCLPVWFFTSRVYRADLPDLSLGLGDKWLVPLRLIIDKEAGGDCSILPVLRESLNAVAPRRFRYTVSCLELSLPLLKSAASDVETDTALAAVLADLSTAGDKSSTPSSTLTFFLLRGPATVGQPTWQMGQHRHGWSQFSDASVSTLPQLAQLLTLPAESTVHDQARLPSVTDFTLSFTLLNARPDGLWFGWDIEEAVQQYVTPFVTKILPVVTTTSDSQVLHFAGVSDRVQFDAKMQMHYITPEDLSRFVGGTKWNVVSPLVSNSVELMVYIPPVEQRPLLVREADRSFSASFIVPRWGGVAILNDVPASANCSGGTGACRVQISANELKGVMASLIAQLRVMIGLTPNEQVLRVPGVIEFLGAPAQGITDWELDALMRTKLLDNLVEVTGTLNSLYELLEEQTHMPVEDTIQHSVQHAFDKFRAAIAGATVGEYREGMVASRAALGSAKQAFFHPSMLPLLYFPDEHVYAVYAPFFLPIIVPVLGALLAYIKRIRKKSAKAKLK